MGLNKNYHHRLEHYLRCLVYYTYLSLSLSLSLYTYIYIYRKLSFGSINVYVQQYMVLGTWDHNIGTFCGPCSSSLGPSCDWDASATWGPGASRIYDNAWSQLRMPGVSHGNSLMNACETVKTDCWSLETSDPVDKIPSQHFSKSFGPGSKRVPIEALEISMKSLDCASCKLCTT